MGIKDATKTILAQALDDLLKTTPMQKISVKSLCAQCGAERQTFYYHFKDKYDLATWMLFRDFDTALEQFGGNYSAEQLTAYLETIRGHQLFYKRLYNDEMNALLPKFIFQQEAERIRGLVQRQIGTEHLSETQELAVLFYVNGCIGTVISWAHSGYRTPPERLAGLHYAMLDMLLRDIRTL